MTKLNRFNQVIRWPGLIAFVGIVAAVAAVWYLLVDYVIEYTVERTATTAVGAKVELASADFTLFPLGLELTDLQVTNPKQPMRNAVIADRIRMTLNFGHLIKGKKVVEDMSATGIAFDTERTTSGALKKAKTRFGKDPGIREKIRSRLGEFPSFATQNAKEILENEKLVTLEQAEVLKADIIAERKKFEERMKTLPDKETFEEYKNRIKEIRQDSGLSGGVMGAIGKADEIRKIKKDMETDLEVLRRTSKELNQSREEFQNRLKDLKNAPARDAERLTEKYAISPKGIGNMSALVFGPKYAGWMETGLVWYQRLSPYLAGMMRAGESGKEKPPRREGIDVEFTPRRQIPRYWIKTATLAMEIDGNSVTGRFSDLSSDQQALGQPFEFSFSGTGLKDTGTLDVNGHMDRTRPDSPEDWVEFTLKQYPLTDLVLLDRKDLSLFLESARLENAAGSIEIADENMKADIGAVFDSVALNVQPGQANQKKNLLVGALSDTLANIRTFDIAAAFNGNISQPEVQITSSIDDILETSLKQMLTKRSDAFKKDIGSAIAGQTDDAVASAASELSGLDVIKDELLKRLALGPEVDKLII